MKYKIVKLVGVNPSTLKALEALMSSNLVMSRSQYWGRHQHLNGKNKPRTGLSKLCYAEILDSKRNKVFGTYTVEIKIPLRSELMQMMDASGTSLVMSFVHVLTPAYVEACIMHIVEPRVYRGILADEIREDIVAPIYGSDTLFIDLSGLIEIEIEVGQTIKLYKREGQEVFFQASDKRYGGMDRSLSLGDSERITQSLPGTVEAENLEDVASYLRWKGAKLKLERDWSATDPFLKQSQWGHFNIIGIGGEPADS